MRSSTALAIISGRSVKIRIACPNCDKPYVVDEGSLGRMANCSQCGEQFELSPSVSQPMPLREESSQRSTSRRAGSVSDRSSNRPHGKLARPPAEGSAFFSAR